MQRSWERRESQHPPQTRRQDGWRIESCWTSCRSVTGRTADSKAPDISIHDAVEKGNIEAVKQHIAAGTDVNAKGGVTGGTPLLIAVTLGNKEIAELLIAEGADVNAKDVNGKTPLDNPIRRKHPEIADLIRKHGGKTGQELKAEDKWNTY
jgi:ankyrin repeat protein